MQKRSFDYRAPRSAATFNELTKGIMPVGVWDGFLVSSLGEISPGIFFTSEGVKIEETTPVTVDIPPGHATLYRRDRIIMRFEFEQSVPAPVATYEVIEGTPATNIFPDFALPPPVPAGAYSLATALVEPLGTEWTDIYMPIKPMIFHNCYQDSSGDIRIKKGALPALIQYFDRDEGAWNIFVQKANEVADDDSIGSTMVLGLQVTDQGVAEINNKMPLAGGTFSGPVQCDDTVNFNDAAIFNHDDPTAVAFDDWIEFVRMVHPAEANSADWVNSTYFWESISDLTGKVLVIPIPQYVGAELVSLDIGMWNSTGTSYDYIVGLSSYPLGDIQSTVDFSAATWSINGNTEEYNRLTVESPDSPYDPLPYVFADNKHLYLRIKTGAAGLRFTGLRCNYRRKQLAL